MTREQLFQSFLGFAKSMGKLEAGQENIKTSLDNHLSEHKVSKVFQAIYFGLIILMFCFLKWGI